MPGQARYRSTAALARRFNVGFVVDGFWPALFGALVVRVVSLLRSMFLPDDQERRVAYQ